MTHTSITGSQRLNSFDDDDEDATQLSDVDMDSPRQPTRGAPSGVTRAPAPTRALARAPAPAPAPALAPVHFPAAPVQTPQTSPALLTHVGDDSQIMLRDYVTI